MSSLETYFPNSQQCRIENACKITQNGLQCLHVFELVAPLCICVQLMYPKKYVVYDFAKWYLNAYSLCAQGHFHLCGLTLIPAWISNYILYKLWDEATYPFPKYRVYRNTYRVVIMNIVLTANWTNSVLNLVSITYIFTIVFAYVCLSNRACLNWNCVINTHYNAR